MLGGAERSPACSTAIFHNWHDILKVEDIPKNSVLEHSLIRKLGKALDCLSIPRKPLKPKKSKKHETILCVWGERERNLECTAARDCVNGTNGTNQHSRKCTRGEILYVWDYNQPTSDEMYARWNMSLLTWDYFEVWSWMALIRSRIRWMAVRQDRLISMHEIKF